MEYYTGGFVYLNISTKEDLNKIFGNPAFNTNVKNEECENEEDKHSEKEFYT